MPDFAVTIFPQTPAEHIAVLEDARRTLVARLAEAHANLFVIALRHPTKEGEPFFVVASCSFGFYVGSMLNAQLFSPPLDVQLTGFRLPDGETPKPEMMLYRNAINEAIADTDRTIAFWKSKEN